jgi:hypothetical protein
MYLFHATEAKYINMIIKDGKLRISAKTLKKNQNPYDIYLPYNFFATIPSRKSFINKIVNITGIIFDISFLLNHVFYTNKNYSAGNLKSSIKYKFDNLKDINNILYKLYKQSTIRLNQHKLKSTEAYLKFILITSLQEIFTKVEVPMKYARYIYLNKNNEKLEKLIKTKYPHIEILPENKHFKI